MIEQTEILHESTLTEFQKKCLSALLLLSDALAEEPQFIWSGAIADVVFENTQDEPLSDEEIRNVCQTLKQMMRQEMVEKREFEQTFFRITRKGIDVLEGKTRY